MGFLFKIPKRRLKKSTFGKVRRVVFIFLVWPVLSEFHLLATFLGTLLLALGHCLAVSPPDQIGERRRILGIRVPIGEIQAKFR